MKMILANDNDEETNDSHGRGGNLASILKVLTKLETKIKKMSNYF